MKSNKSKNFHLSFFDYNEENPKLQVTINGLAKSAQRYENYKYSTSPSDFEKKIAKLMILSGISSVDLCKFILY